MAGRIPLSDRKQFGLMYGTGKENAHTVVQNAKSTEGKNNGGGVKKKGLSLNAENRAVRTTLGQGCSSVDKAKFQIYSDDNDENDRSRPRVRKDVCRKEIRAKQDSRALEKATVSPTKADIPDSRSRAVLRRTRSSSNSRQKVPLALNETVKMNNKLFHNRRAYSETRKQLFASRYSHYVPQSSDDRKIKHHLTDDVKKRTFSSIEMWKDKMRKPHTGTVPKNIMGNKINVDKTRVKTQLQKSSVHGSMDLQSQNHVTNLDESIEEPARKTDSIKNVLIFLSNEIANILEDQPSSKAQAAPRNFIQDNHLSTTIMVNSNIATRSDSPYEKRVMTQTSLTKQENELDNICETMYVRDYLEDVPETERNKEENAPRLSLRFLRENVNAEQRRLIVGYIIRLGVHCHYSQHIIYQTIKLFNVAIDRIWVETNDIQLMSLACLWITLKREAPDHRIPSATAILQLAKDLYINQEKCLITYEKKILSAVKFNTRFADPFSLLSYYVLNVNRDSECSIVRSDDIAFIYFCASYMIDISMLDESLCDIPAHVIAIVAVELSLRLVYSSDVNVNQAWYQVWRSKQSLTEWEERMVKSTKRLIIKHALQHDKFSSNVIYKKYMRSKYGKVTKFLHDKLNTVNI